MSLADFLDELTKCETPAMAWLRTAVTPERRAQWEAEDKAIADADRKQGSK